MNVEVGGSGLIQVLSFGFSSFRSRRRAGLPAFGVQRLTERRQRQCINYILLRQPAFPRDARAKAQKSGVFIAMAVAIDDAFHTFALRIRPQPPIHIETVWTRI